MFPRIITYQNDKSFFLFGPRGVGKTAWLKATFPDSLYFDLLDNRTYSMFVADPARLADRIPNGYSDWVILDEVQRIPDLLNEVHRLIESRKLKFVLTGSSARKLRKKGTNLLAGRALVKYMHPLTAVELGATFETHQALRFGTLPSVYVDSDPKAYLDSYVGTYLREEVLQEGLTRNLSNFSRFLEVVTFSQAEVLTMNEVAREAMVSPKVVQDYFVILEDLLLAVRLPIFTKAAKRKLISHPKFFLFDSGVFNSLRPRGPLDHPESIPGASVETLFFQQFRAINDYRGYEFQLFYWRTQKKEEVDFIAYGPRGILAFELKHSTTVRKEDFSGLREFQKDYPSATCYLVNMGSEKFEENGIKVIPLPEIINKFDEILK